MRFSFILLLSAMVPSLAFAMECRSDADCGEHFYCMIRDAAVPCSVDPDGNEDCPEPEGRGVGECVPGPISCEDDGDCPGISTCIEEVSVSTMDCADDGEPCEPVEVEEVIRTCGFEAAECEESADCAEGFRCQQFDQPCPRIAIACPDGADCEPPEPQECPEDTVGRCVIDEIPCDSDDACLAGWRCQSIETTTCDDGGSRPISAGSSMASSGGRPGAPQSSEPAEGDEPGAEDEPGADDVPEPQEPEREPGEPVDNDADVDLPEGDGCVTETRQLCAPEGYEHYLGGANAFASGDGESVIGGDGDQRDLPASQEAGADSASSSPNSSSSDSGCDISASNTTSGRSFLGTLFILLAVRRLRQRLN